MATEGVRTKIPLLQRPVDILICILYLYYLWSAIFIERYYCAAPLDASSTAFILKATYEYSEKYNPLFLERPEWLQAATCISAYGLGLGYVFGAVMFIFGIDSLRIPTLMFCSFKLYAMVLYYGLELFGSLPAPDLVMFLAADGPYLVGLALILFRMRQEAPFSVFKAKSQ